MRGGFFGNLLKRASHSGFALPTILVASTVMLVVLASTLTVVSSTTLVAMETRHYTLLARNASQSGLAMARACLQSNNYVPQWTNANPLRPNTNCQGAVQTGLSPSIHVEGNVQLRFSVPAPETLANGVQRINVNGYSDRLRTSSGIVWRSYSDAVYATISAQTSFNNVTFGYSGGNGAFFGVIDGEGAVNAVGFNGEGQLGNGTTTNSVTPRAFMVPSNLRTSQLFTSFLSVGASMYAITTDGQVYGAGRNVNGQLGNGAMAAAQSTPVRFNLPAGVRGQFVSVGQNYTLVLGSDNNVYSAGDCAYGALGYSYTISGCSSQSSYRRVALPAVNTGNLNTIPVATSDWLQDTNISSDRRTSYVRMRGGQVWAWGANESGELGNGNRNDSSTPVQVTSLGNPGQPTATQVAFDGQTVWILDSNGDVWATGDNDNGQLGTASPIISGSSKCIDNPSNGSTNGTRIQIYDCNDTNAQMLEWAQNGSLVFRPTPATTKCLDNANNNQANGNPIQLYDCNGSPAQMWRMDNNGKIVLQGTNKCIDNPGNASANGTRLQLYDCNASATFPNQTWALGGIITPKRVVLPAGQGKVSRITTDQWATLFIMTNGTVWGYGHNSSGQLGNGTLNNYSPRISQYILPSGRTANNIYTTKSGPMDELRYANTYVVLDNGSVYGSGSNYFGQMGNGTTGTTVATPVRMTLPAGVVAQSVQTGFGTTVILTNEGRIFTVGNNGNGQLGDGTTTNSSIPSARQYVNQRPLVLY
jgi:alpha-tubulin suppressor-like RCC1 family protein